MSVGNPLLQFEKGGTNSRQHSRHRGLLVIHIDGEVFLALEGHYLFGTSFGACRKDDCTNRSWTGIRSGSRREIRGLNVMSPNIDDLDGFCLDQT